MDYKNCDEGLKMPRALHVWSAPATKTLEIERAADIVEVLTPKEEFETK